ncbi:MAG: hypothetical protein RR194_04090, partial [Ruthenibacterium sp.]
MKNRLLAVLPAAVLLCSLTLPAFAESVPAPAAKALSAQSTPARENSAPPAALVPDNTARVELPSFDVPCRTAILVAAD